MWKDHHQPKKSNSCLHVTFIWYRCNSNTRDTEGFFTLCNHCSEVSCNSNEVAGREGEKEEHEKTPLNFHVSISEIAFKLNNEIVSEVDNIPV